MSARLALSERPATALLVSGYTEAIVSDVVEKITTRRREDGGVVVDKKCKKSTNFQQNSPDLLAGYRTAITHAEIQVAYF